MKFETIRNAIKIRLFAFAVLAVGLCASTGYAQTDFSGKFNLPYEVQWGRTVLPAGQYAIEISAFSATAKVRSADGKMAFYTPIPVPNHSEKGTAALMVLASGDKRVVVSLNLPQRGISLVYRPIKPAEREMLAKADHPTPVPLITAGK
jgi:hypothetical protein